MSEHKLITKEAGTRVTIECACGAKLGSYTYGNMAGYSYGKAGEMAEFVSHLEKSGVLQLRAVSPSWASQAVSVYLSGKYVGTAGERKDNSWGWMRGGHFRAGSRFGTVKAAVFSMLHFIETGESLWR